MTGSPAQVGPGFVVRIRLGNHFTYCSTRQTRETAEVIAQRVREALHGHTGLVLLVDFPACDYTELSLRASMVNAVEVRPVTGDPS